MHISHPTFEYLIEAVGWRSHGPPDSWNSRRGQAAADLMFADAAGWARPIRFAYRASGRTATVVVAEQAIRHGVQRLIFAHIGRPTIAALDAGQVPPFGEFGTDDAIYTLQPAPGYRG